MFGSTLSLAMGVMLLAVARFAADPGALDLVVVLGIAFVAMACALHTGAIVDQLTFLPALVRGLAMAMGWLAFAIATVWLLSLVAPGPEILLALVMTPAALGLLRLLVSPTDRGWAAAFLIEAVALVGLLGPIFVRRLMT